jgi:hypothetical protein
MPTRIHITDGSSGTLPIGAISASGTPSSGTFLRGDGQWAEAGGSVTDPLVINRINSTGTLVLSGSTGVNVSSSLTATTILSQQDVNLDIASKNFSTSGGNINITAGFNTGSSIGGSVIINSGNGSTSQKGGSTYIFGGKGGIAGGQGGDVIASGGQGGFGIINGSGYTGGSVIIAGGIGGQGAGSGVPGPAGHVVITGGSGSGSSPTGDVTIAGGSSSAAAGGNVYISSGNGSGSAGTLSLDTGVSTATTASSIITLGSTNAKQIRIGNASAAVSVSGALTASTFIATSISASTYQGTVSGLAKTGSAIGTAYALDFTGTGIGAITIANNTASIQVSAAAISGSGSPGSPSNSIQYNSGGLFGGAGSVLWAASSNSLQFSASAGSSAAPAGSVHAYARNRAGRELIEARGSTMKGYSLQPSLFGSSVTLWVPNQSTTVSIAYGDTWLARNTTGAQSRPTLTTASLYTGMMRNIFAAAGSGTSCGIQTTNPSYFRGVQTGSGGFFGFFRFGVEATGTSAAMMIGFSANNATIAVGNPSQNTAFNNMIALTKDVGETVWYLTTRTTTSTRTATSLSFSAGNIYDLTMYCPPAPSTSVIVRLVNESSGTTLLDNVTITGTLPATGTMMYAQWHVRSGGATAPSMGVSKAYIEADF